MKLLIKINFIIALIVSLTSVSYACNFLKESMGTSIATLGDRYDEFTYLQKMIMEMKQCLLNMIHLMYVMNRS